ncbi:cell cycle transcriptional regulator TrcR [Candidatus Liberibacter brunswickensis]|uniref:cell cycle transcriptional regulator TrcR n=1 Tax=Candidatus Liberibacter brunswickensis TaxID=1968796 RepID=UPI002FDF9662
MCQRPLMPKASAVWLIENTSLSFDQIAEFCGLHLLEVLAIADGESLQGIKGLNLISSGQLSPEEISKGEKDKNYKLKISKPPQSYTIETTKKKKRYTPVSKRQDRPNAILWLIRNYPKLKDSQISHLVSTTRATIEQIRNRTHWNTANLVPIDPVTLGLCSQIDLDSEIKKSLKNIEGKNDKIISDISKSSS